MDETEINDLLGEVGTNKEETNNNGQQNLDDDEELNKLLGEDAPTEQTKEKDVENESKNESQKRFPKFFFDFFVISSINKQTKAKGRERR